MCLPDASPLVQPVLDSLCYSFLNVKQDNHRSEKEHARSYSCSQVGDGWNDLPTNDLERLNPVDLRNHTQDRLNPHRGEPAQLPDQPAHFGTILAHVEGKCAGLLNRVVI